MAVILKIVLMMMREWKIKKTPQVRGRGKRSRRHGLSFHGLAEGVEEAVANF